MKILEGYTLAKRALHESSCIIWRVIFGDRKAIRQIRQSLAPQKFSAIWYHIFGTMILLIRRIAIS